MALFGNLDFGLPLGLAYRHDWQRGTYLALEAMSLKRRREIDAENKARLLADDLKTTSVAYPWHNELLTKRTSQILDKAQEFMRDNPEFERDPILRVQLKKITRGLLTAPETMEAARIQTHQAAMQRWINSQESISPLMQKYIDKKQEEFANAINTGDILGRDLDFDDPNRIEFEWRPPTSPFNPLEIIRTEISKLQYGPSYIINDRKSNTRWASVSPDDVKAKIQQVIQSPLYVDAFKDYYNNLKPEERRGKDIVEHLYNLNKANVPSRYLGQMYSISGGRGGGGAKAAKAQQETVWVNDVYKKINGRIAKGQLNPIVTADQSATANAVLNADKETINVSQGSYMLMSYDDPRTGKRIEKMIDFPAYGNYQATPTGRWTKVKRPESGVVLSTYFVESQVVLSWEEASRLEDPLSQLTDQAFKKEVTGPNGERIDITPEQIFDRDFETFIPFFDVNMVNDLLVEDPFRETVQILKDDDDPERLKGIGFTIWTPYNYSQASELAYNNTVTNKIKGAIPRQAQNLYPGMIITLSNGVKAKLLEPLPGGGWSYEKVE